MASDTDVIVNVPPKSENEDVQKDEPTVADFTIAVKTSNKFGAGTDANIYCELIGTNGKSPAYHLRDSLTHKNKFERNSEDVFLFKNQTRVGDILQVRVWHDNAGQGAAWHLGWITVNDSADNMTYTFPCRRWLATNEDDGQIMRLLDCTKKGVPLASQFGIKYVQQADGTMTAQVYLPTGEFLRDSMAGCLRSDRQWTRDFFGEFLGTMFLVTVLDGAVAQFVLGGGSHGDFVCVCFAGGLAITFGVYLSGNSSGGHINPAVTLVMTLLGRTTWAMLPLYWLAQYLGGIFGAAIVYGVYYDAINEYDNGTRQVYGDKATAGIFATYPQDFLYSENGFLDQVVGTAILTQLVFAVTDPRNHNVPQYLIPLLVGLTVTLIGMSFGFNCGFAINPARDLGPRIFTAMAGWGLEVFSYRDHNWFWVPIAGPHVGALLGTVIYMLFVGLHWPQTYEAAEEAKKKHMEKLEEEERRKREDADMPELYEKVTIVKPPPTVVDPAEQARKQAEKLEQEARRKKEHDAPTPDSYEQGFDKYKNK